MDKKKSKVLHNNKIVVTFLITMIVILIGLAHRTWLQYKNILMDNQKDQLLNTAQILGNYMSMSLNNYQDGVEYLVECEESGKLDLNMAKSYLDNRKDYVVDICWFDNEHNLLRNVCGIDVIKSFAVSSINAEYEIWQYVDGSGKKYIGFDYVKQTQERISLLVDEEKYYEKLISDIQIGSNGYIMIKNSFGKILMHPEEEQWGLDVVEGRKELYPDLDYSSLETLIEKQMSGNTEIYEYFSYWWGNEKLEKVKKVSAFAPARIGEDFWIVSLVTDYDDLYMPIANSFLKIVVIFAGVFCIFSVLFYIIIKLILEQRKSTSEISYLKELNGILEETHRSEEAIRHQQRLQIMGTMTGGIVHEFNNFLTPILGYSELLQCSLDSDSEEYDYANEIYEAAEKAKDIIRQISSLNRKNVDTVYVCIEVKKLVRRFLKMASSLCPEYVQLDSQLMEEEKYILGNTTQINQVLLNIFLNAIQSLDVNDGKICIRCNCVEKNDVLFEKISEGNDTWKEYISISIQDNGCGIDDKIMNQIFDPFFTTKKLGKGTGLGLALAEQIIMSHKGKIHVESEMGKGSTFYIFLPVIEQNIQSEISNKTQEDRVFVIADYNNKILQMLKNSLQKIGITVYTCNNKRAIYKCLDEHLIDVLLIDEIIENVSGIEIAMSLRHNHPQTLIIIMATRITKEVAEAKRNGLIDGYIEKPVSDMVVLETVRNCMKEKKYSLNKF